ncbi:MAG: DUF4446 family protein [Bacillota bacterium]
MGIELYSRYGGFLLIGATILAFISFSLSIINYLKIAGLDRRYKFLNKVARNEESLLHLQKSVEGLERLKRRIDALSAEQERFSLLLRKCTRTPVMKRFNAFDDVGSDLSFSIALLDGEGNGLILTSLYGREETRTYAKKVSGGIPATRVSVEEEEVLREARSQN